MKNYSAAYRAHLRQPLTTLAICCKIIKQNGEVVLGTTHDRDIEVTVTNIGMELGSPPLDLAGVYHAGAGIMPSDIRSNYDMAVNNLEVEGALQPSGVVIPDLTVADIEAGLYRAAQVTIFRVNFQNPDDFQDVLEHGTLGEIEWTSEGQYKSEVRGIAQLLQQTLGQTAGENCNVVEFGDDRCKYPIEDATATGQVTAVTSRKRFDANITLGAVHPVTFSLGKVTFLSGENAGYTRQVKLDSVGDVFGQIQLFDAFPLDIEVGDQFRITPGCDRRFETCKLYDNVINMRAAGLYAPGPDEIIRSP